MNATQLELHPVMSSVLFSVEPPVRVCSVVQFMCLLFVSFVFQEIKALYSIVT